MAVPLLVGAVKAREAVLFVMRANNRKVGQRNKSKNQKKTIIPGEGFQGRK